MILCLFCLAILAAGGILLWRGLNSDRSVDYDYASDAASVEMYSRVLRVAGGSDFSPFSYLDENGLPCGHDVELAFAMGRELGYRVEVTLGDWTEMQAGLLDGTYDMLMTVDYSEERSLLMGYTNPVCLDSYVFFGRNAGLDLTSLDSLKQLRIAALDGGGATENYLEPLGLLGNTRFFSTQAEAFRSVASGESDLAIAGYIYGSNIIAGLELGLKQVGTPLYGSAYYFTYNIQNAALGNRLNNALATLSAAGELRRIDEKWTVHYQPNLTLQEFLQQNHQTVLIGSLLAVLLVAALTAGLRMEKQKRERNLLERDQLTGLYHMHAFQLHMGQILEKHPGRDYVLIRFDLDNFKSFNSTQGTKAGDLLLKQIGSELIKLQQSRTDLLLCAYLGADHFAVLTLRDTVDSDPEVIYREAVKLVDTASAGYNLSVCMGLAAVNGGKEDPGLLCDHVLLALRSVKNDYYRHWAWFDENARVRLEKEQQISERMHRALEGGQFVPYFQPQYDYESGLICGAEALARWQDPERGLISPAEFVPLFEKNGFIYEMDKAIWHSVCRKIREWREAGLKLPPISVNISRADIFHSDLVETLTHIVWEENCCMAELRLEITESSYLDNSSLLIETVRRLRALGAHVEMDDFGSGYSTLSSLKDMDVDTIKLDMSLLQNNSLSGKHAVLLDAIVRLGHGMGAGLIAEGVEKPEQAAYLHSVGCNVMQGYLYSRPITGEAFEALLRKQNKAEADSAEGDRV